MYVASEEFSWCDPNMLTLESFEQIGDEHQEIKHFVSEMVRRRIETRTLTDCPLNSRSVHDSIDMFYKTTGTGGAAPAPAVGCYTERVLCPIDLEAGPFAHVACASGTYAVVTEHLPQHLYLFNQRNDIPTSRLNLVKNNAASSFPLSTEAQDTEKVFFDENDIVTALFLDPRGNFCVVRWRFGKTVFFHIPRFRRETRPVDDAAPQPKKEPRDGDMTPRQFPLQFHSSVTGTRQPFVIECIAWDSHNQSDETTGDIILGSSSGGIILACRLESHGIVAARKVYQFPQPYSSYPIDSVAYTVVRHSHAESLRRHVVIIAQRNRMFVFAAPWGCSSTLEVAFNASRTHPRSGAPPSAFPHPNSSCFFDSAVGISDGDLVNYITVGGSAVGGSPHVYTSSSSSPPFISLGSHHRELSTTAIQAGANAAHASSAESSFRLFNRVTILESCELLPCPTVAVIAEPTAAVKAVEGSSDGGGVGGQSALPPLVAADELPPVFCWQYGDMVTHGVVILANLADTSASEDSSSPYASPFLRSQMESSFLALHPTVNATRRPASENKPPANGLLPIGVLSVVNLGRCLRDLSQLMQHGTKRQPPMFRHAPPPASAAATAASTSPNASVLATPSSYKMSFTNAIRTRKAIKTEDILNSHSLLLRQVGLNDIKTLSKIRRGIYRETMQMPSLPVPLSSSITDTLTPGREVSHDKGGQDEEELVSFTMGYGHFVVTTTHAVYVFCHLAAIPIPQTGIEWKNHLVFFQKLVETSAMGSGSMADRGSAHTAVFSTHSVCRSEVFSLFTSSYIVNLLPRSRRSRCVQHIAQLMDVARRIHHVVANTVAPNDDNDGDDDVEGKNTIANDFNASPLSTDAASTSAAADSTSMQKSVKHRLSSSPISTLCKGSLYFRMQRFVQSSNVSDRSKLWSGTSFDYLCGNEALPPSPAMRLHADSARNVSDNTILEDLALTYGSRAMVFPHIGTLGGHVEDGFHEQMYYDSDNLYGMALRLAAFAPLVGERREMLSRVRHSYAACLFHQGRFLEAAAQHGLAFDGPPYLNTLLVEFSRVAMNDMEPLILLLLLSLKGYEQPRRGVGAHSVEVSCLATWLISLLLERCNQQLKNQKCEGDAISTPLSPLLPLPRDSNNVISMQVRSVCMLVYLRQKYNLHNPRQLLDQIIIRFRTFVEWNAIKAAVFGIASAEFTIHLCDLMGRDEEALSCFLIQQESPLDGLLRLEQQNSRVIGEEAPGGSALCNMQRSKKRYWTQYAALLMRRCPCRFVRRVLIPLGSDLGLHPVQLFPALLLYEERYNETVLEADASVDVLLRRHTFEDSLLDEERARAPYHAARLYLEHTIQVEQYTEGCLLSLLLYFTARDGDDIAITRFFAEFCTDIMAGQLEISYAHRLCCRFDRLIGCAWLFFISGRYCEAVRLAMQLQNEELALQFIHRIKEEEGGRTRRALWKELAIDAARNKQGGVRRALQLVVESGGGLTVSDVLPHLSEDVMLQEFREELLLGVSSSCHMLAEYKRTINTSINDMEVLQRDVEAARYQHMTLPTTQQCDLCGQPVLTRSFVVFRGCNHVYHMTCFNKRRTHMEEQLQCLDKSATPLPLGRDGVWGFASYDAEVRECVLCSTRYLRLQLTTLLSTNMKSNKPRLL